MKSGKGKAESGKIFGRDLPLSGRVAGAETQITNTMNKSAFMRRGQVVEWLKEEGFLENQIRIMFETGGIVSLKLPGKESGRSLFSRAQIERDVLGVLLKC